MQNTTRIHFTIHHSSQNIHSYTIYQLSHKKITSIQKQSHSIQCDSNVINVTQCMWYHVNPKFHRFPIQYLESKPCFHFGQDQSHNYEPKVSLPMFQSHHCEPKVSPPMFKIQPK